MYRIVIQVSDQETGEALWTIDQKDFNLDQVSRVGVASLMGVSFADVCAAMQKRLDSLPEQLPPFAGA